MHVLDMKVLKLLFKIICHLVLIIADCWSNVTPMILSDVCASATGHRDDAFALLKIHLLDVPTSHVRSTIVPQLFALLTASLVVWFLEAATRPALQRLNGMGMDLAVASPAFLIFPHPCVGTLPLIPTIFTGEESKFSFWLQLL